MLTRRFGWIPVLAALSFSTASAAACKLLETPPIPVTLQGLRPTIVARINGVKARFIVDTGAFYSLLSPAAAAEYKLPLRNTVSDDSVWGLANGGQDDSSELSVRGFGGGEAAVQVATVKSFTYLGVPLRNMHSRSAATTWGAASPVYWATTCCTSPTPNTTSRTA